MRFRKKIIVTYTVFLIIITSLFVGIIYTINVRHLREQVYENMNSISDVRRREMESIIRDMESAVHVVLSDVGVVNAFRVFSETEFASLEDFVFSESRSTIQAQLKSFSLSDRFHRILAFNKDGFTISSGSFWEDVILNTMVQIEKPHSIEELRAKGKQGSIIGLHRDNWDHAIISYVSGVEYANMGFIEVQLAKQKLDEIFVSEDRHYEFLFLGSDRRFLYASDANLSEEDWDYLFNATTNRVHEMVDNNGDNVLVHLSYSDHYDFYTITISNNHFMKELYLNVIPLSALLLITGISISVFFIYISSKRLTKPIQQLQKLMEDTQLENMMENTQLESLSIDEMKALFLTYQELLERLNQSIVRSEKLSLMQLQAQFDLLQTQVNPHFIYNVLNVISSRGVVLDDETVCEICNQLACMLRYSTNTRDKYATLQQEVDYLELYLGLLKHRYDYKLSYQITIADEIRDTILPRIVLQLIVENAIKHGMGTLRDCLTINVFGEVTDYGWKVSITDDGIGIDQDKVIEIMKAFDTIRESLSSARHNIELEIGGMGLANTYARLYIFFQERLKMEIHKIPQGGTKVTIFVSTK